MFEGLRARIEKFLADHTAPMDSRSRAALLQEAVVEAKVAIGNMGTALGATERELLQEREQLEATQRRGALAAGIPDAETVAVAERFAARHRERIGVLEKKLAAQREELALAERDLETMVSELRGLRQSGPAAASAEAAWRDLEAAGGARPATDVEGELLRQELDRARGEAAAEAQLRELKKKLGKD